MSKVKEFFKGWSMFEKCWLVLSTVIMIVLSIIWGDNTLALISGISGILGVVLAAKGKVSTYVFATWQAMHILHLIIICTVNLC